MKPSSQVSQSSRRRLIARGTALFGAMASGPVWAQLTQVDEYGDAALRGAGSTFVRPLMEAWVRQYRSDPYSVMVAAAPNGGLGDTLSNDGLDYEPVGSLAGIQRIRAGLVDFAASEMPLSDDPLQRAGLMQFPWVIGGVAIVATVPGADALRLDAPTLAAIFQGRITRWSDPAIAGQNPGTALPEANIAVQHRSDGSGTTFTLATYLSRKDAQWKVEMGGNLLLKRPIGRGHRGSGEMIKALKSTPHAIGYVDVVQARQAGLPVVMLRNAEGRHVAPDAAALSAAFSARPRGPGEVESLPIDAPGERSYPLVATVFGFLRTPIRSGRQRRTAEFLAWTLIQGAALTRELGYLSVPEAAAKATVERLTHRA